MKKLLLSMIIGVASTVSWGASCNYSFNATQAQIDTYNSSHTRKREFMTSIDLSTQQGTSVIKLIDNPTSDQVLISAGGMNDLPDKAVVTNGIIAFEAEIDTSQLQSLLTGSTQETQQMGFAITGSSSAGKELGINLAQSIINNSPTSVNGNHLTIIGGSFNNSNGQTSFKDLDPRSFTIQMPTTGKVRFGVYINQQSKQIGFIVNNINYGYMNVIANNPITKIGFFAEAQDTPYSNSKFIGKAVTLKLITDQAQFTQSYPSGATDICGTAI
ncbi:exported protein [Acinetobacter sp. neg1]|jgi:hypothetical protein|uniref:DUF4882 family protein n=1 Tax=Acinetobacter TaxID=469 RepID=UPI0005445568|nr:MULTISPECIES: DUF4882 family protein [Acinetobacter]KHF77939.1 exported protein [Acinetobacter sp. neg1]MBJ8482050.1 DUF4882 family protein [Acinetobacter vivianii]